MKRFEIPVMISGEFQYRCEKCGTIIVMKLQKGVEERTEDAIPSPFSINCPNKCPGMCPMMHINFTLDRRYPKPIEARAGEFVFLYDWETKVGKPVQIIDTEFWIAKTFGREVNEIIFLAERECDQEKIAEIEAEQKRIADVFRRMGEVKQRHPGKEGEI